MNIFKKIAIKLKLIKPKQNWFKNFFKSFRSLFSLKSKKSKFFVSAFVVLALASGFFVVYSQNGNNSDGEVSLSKGLVAHWTMDEEDYEEGTVNLVANSLFNVPWGRTWGSGVTELTAGYNNVGNSMRMIKTSTSKYGKYELSENTFLLEQGDVITISFWGRANRDGVSMNYNYIMREGMSNLGNFPNLTFNQNWEKKEVTYTYTATEAANCSLMLAYDSSSAEINDWVEISMVQIERGGHATPFVDGSRVDRVVDKTPYENHGTNYGATFTEDRFGKEGGAMSFNGSNYINISNPINQNNLDQEWTVSAWVDIDDKDSQYLIKNMNNGLSLTYGSSNNLILYLNSGSNDYYVYGKSTGLLKEQGWKHVVFVFRNKDGLRKIYIDGEDKTGSGPNKTSIPRGISATLQVGYGVKGRIDDVRIYNRALSEEEIKSLYETYNPKTTTGSLQKGLVLDMPLKLKYTKSETSGSEIMTDRTPYSNDAQNHGATITNEGARFNENLGYIELNYSSQYNIKEEITLSVWMKRFKEKSGGDIHILSRPPSWYFYDSPSGLVGGYLFIDGASRAHLSTKIEADSNWHHILYTYDSKTKKAVIYKDGQISNEASLSGLSNYSIDSSFSNMRPIGKTTSSNDFFLSNLSVYDRALSEEEVKTLYDRGRSDAGIIFQEN